MKNTSTNTDYHVRNCGRKDHTSILAIEKECFGRQNLNQGDIDDLFKNCYCLVVVFDSLVVGYLTYEKNRNDHSLTIKRWAVSPQNRNEGAGTNLLEKLVATNKGSVVRVKVREQSLEFQMFLKGRGFKCVPIGHRKSRQESSVVQTPYYIESRGFDNGDDAMLFELGI